MTTPETSTAPRNTEEQLVRIRLDRLIRQTWCALRDLSDYRNGEALTQEDLDLWGRITPHPAIQRVLNRAIADNQAHGRSPVKPLVGNVVTVELDDVVTNPDDMKSGNVSYVGVRKTNKETA